MSQKGLPFCFPVLPLNVLEQELASLLGIRVTIRELSKPSSEKVVEIFEKFLQDLNVQAFQKIYSIPENAKSLIDYPEIYEDSLRLLKRKAAVSEVLCVAMGGVSELQLTDLVEPDARRFQRHLSALINYKKFRDEKLVKFRENQQQVDSLSNQVQQLQDENLQVTSELKQLQTKRRQDEQETQQIMVQTIDLDNRRKVAYDQCLKLQQETKNAKALYNQKKNEVTSLKLELKSAEQVMQFYRDQLVDSHESLQQNLKEVTEKIESERQRMSETDMKLRDCRKVGDDVKKLCGDVENAVLGAERVGDAIQEKKTLSKGFKGEQYQMQELQRAIKLQELKATHLQKQIDMSQQRLDRYASEKQSKQESFEKAIIEAKQQKAQLQTEVMKSEQTQVYQNMQQIQSIKLEMQQIQKLHDEIVPAMEETAQKLSSNVSSNMEYLSRAMDKRVNNTSYKSFDSTHQDTENRMNLSNIKDERI